jgi:hypothetical protein
VKEKMVEELFPAFHEQIERAGFNARKGQIIDASIVSAPKQRNTREDNAAIQRSEIPEAWKDQPAKLRQKDTEARWTKKHGTSYYEYKNHLSVVDVSRGSRTRREGDGVRVTGMSCCAFQSSVAQSIPESRSWRDRAFTL